MKKAFLLLGGNIGEVTETFHTAILQIQEKCGKLESYSSIYQSDPWGFEADDPFLNQVLCINTQLEAEDLIDILLEIEKNLGRTRSGNGYQSRIIDIDILFIDELIINTQKLTIPHPRFEERLFAIIPVMEIAYNLKHPATGKSISEIKKECTDNGKIAFHTDKILLSYDV